MKGNIKSGVGKGKQNWERSIEEIPIRHSLCWIDRGHEKKEKKERKN